MSRNSFSKLGPFKDHELGSLAKPPFSKWHAASNGGKRKGTSEKTRADSTPGTTHSSGYSQPIIPPGATYQGLIASLIKGNQWFS